MDTNIAYGLMLATLGFFGYVGYQAATEKELDADEYLSARGTQSWQRIGLSLFASGMGIWILFGPSEVGYWGGFWDVVGYAVSASTPFLLLAYVGPMVREKLPDGVTLADYVRMRIGRPMQIYVGVISVIYMFTFLFAEFTAIGKAMYVLSDMDPIIPMLAVGTVTAGYTAYGGLPASLRTDRIQAWVVLWLVVALLLILFAGDISSLISDAKAYNPEGDIEGYCERKRNAMTILADVRAAGSWEAYITYPRRSLLSLRILCEQGRAKPSDALCNDHDLAARILAASTIGEAHSVARAFSPAPLGVLRALFPHHAPISKERPRESLRARTTKTDLPREVFWLILSFWRSDRDHERTPRLEVALPPWVHNASFPLEDSPDFTSDSDDDSIGSVSGWADPA